jgi:hypothetical protein
MRQLDNGDVVAAGAGEAVCGGVVVLDVVQEPSGFLSVWIVVVEPSGFVFVRLQEPSEFDW